MKQPIPHLCLLALLALSGCKSTEMALRTFPGQPLAHRLPSLEPSIDAGKLTIEQGVEAEDVLTLFQTELLQNVVGPQDSTRFGYAKLVVVSAKTVRKGKGFQVLQLATFLTPSLLGLPLEYYCTDVAVELQVLNAHGELAGTYAGEGSSKVPVGFYVGYSQLDAPRVAALQALQAALGQLRPHLAADATNLHAALQAAGTIAVAGEP